MLKVTFVRITYICGIIVLIGSLQAFTAEQMIGYVLFTLIVLRVFNGIKYAKRITEEWRMSRRSLEKRVSQLEWCVEEKEKELENAQSQLLHYKTLCNQQTEKGA